MNFEQANTIIDDGGCDGYGDKLVQKNNQTYLVHICTNDGDVRVWQIYNTPRIWEFVNELYEEDRGQKGDMDAMVDAIRSYSIHLFSTSFWG